MKMNGIKLDSLKTRITLATLSIFVISIWALTFYTSRMLQKDLQQQLGEQQFSVVSILAADVNNEVDSRLRALEKIATNVTPEIMGNTVALQALLGNRPLLLELFNGGVVAYRPDGTAVADVPLPSRRIGQNHMDIDAVAVTLKEGKSAVGQPVMDKILQAPVIGMSVPIRDAQGKVVGALAGVTNLWLPNYLDKITNNLYGKTGGYLIVAPQYRLIVTTSDKKRIMQALPAPGRIPTVDRFIKGYEGSAVFVDHLGVEVLVSTKGIPVAGWYVSAKLPVKEAFAPIDSMQKRMLLATIFLTLLAGALTLWVLNHQLEPILTTIDTLTAMSETSQPTKPLPVERQDEIGQLIGGFNTLLKTIGQREEELKVSEERFRLAIQATNEGLWEWDILTDQEFFSPRWCEIIGYTFDDPELPHCFSSWAERIHPDDFERVMSAQKDHLEHGVAYNVVYRHKHKSGEYRWQNSRGKALFDENGKPVKMVGCISDINDRKQAEVELLESKALIDAVVENVPLMIFLKEATDLRFVLFNRAGEELVGYERKDFLGKNNLDLFPPEQAAHFMAKDREVLDIEGGIVDIPEESILTAKKGLRLLHTRKVCIRGVDGVTKYVLGISEDITERKLVEQELQRKNIEIEQFMYTVSHDLRSPLVTVKTFMGYLEKNLAEGNREELAQDIHFIKSASNKMELLLNELMEFSRIGRIETPPVTVSLLEVLNETLETLAGAIKKRTFEVHLPDTDVTLYGDRPRLCQLWQNLIENAIKYSRDDSTRCIELGWQQVSAETVFFVRDNGVGIDPQYHSKIFGIFEKLDPKSPGAGLGLSMVQRIVEKCDGRIWVESGGSGKGSCFFFTLPHVIVQS